MNYPVIDVAATGRNIGNAIHNSAYSVGDVAAYLGTSTSSVYRYIRGNVLPSTDRLLALSMLLNVSMNDLIGTI